MEDELSEFARLHQFAIPEFTISFAKARTAKFAVLIPVLNEGERIKAQLARMQVLRQETPGLEYDLILVDGGSTDDSLHGRELESKGINTLLIKTGAGKLGSQLRLAQVFALSRDYMGIVHVDGNNKDGVEAIPKFIEALNQGYDFIQGSRFIDGGRAENTPILRYLGIRLLHAPLLSIASGFRYTDTTNGFRATSAKLLRDRKANFFRPEFTGYEYQYYVAYAAAKLGYRCLELPVRRTYPRGQAAPTKITGVRANLRVLKLLTRVCRGKYGP